MWMFVVVVCGDIVCDYYYGDIVECGVGDICGVIGQIWIEVIQYNRGFVLYVGISVGGVVVDLFMVDCYKVDGVFSQSGEYCDICMFVKVENMFYFVLFEEVDDMFCDSFVVWFGLVYYVIFWLQNFLKRFCFVG